MGPIVLWRVLAFARATAGTPKRREMATRVPPVDPPSVRSGETSSIEQFLERLALDAARVLGGAQAMIQKLTYGALRAVRTLAGRLLRPRVSTAIPRKWG